MITINDLLPYIRWGVFGGGGYTSCNKYGPTNYSTEFPVLWGRYSPECARLTPFNFQITHYDSTGEYTSGQYAASNEQEVVNQMVNYYKNNIYTPISLRNLVSCTPSWTCGDWSSCIDGSQVKTCVDGCGNAKTETQSCCIPEWRCNQPLDGKESDGCGNERFSQACIEIVAPPIVEPPPIIEPPITEQPSDNNMLIGTASLLGLVGLGYIAFDEILKKR